MLRLQPMRAGRTFSRALLTCLLASLPLPAQRPASPSPSDGSPRVFVGVLKEISRYSLVLEEAGAGILVFALTPRTSFFLGEKQIVRHNLRPGDELRVESQENRHGFMAAIKVSVLAQADPEGGASAEAGGAGRPTDPFEDPGPPVLRRRKPGEQIPKETADVEPSEPRPDRRPPPPPAPPGDAVIAKARNVSEEFTERLPNFICRQVTTRYFSERLPPQWQAMDVVEADLIYEDEQERYENIKIDGKAVDQEKAKDTGTWSTGEYGTTLRHVLEPRTRARFTYRRADSVSGNTTRVYDYQAKRPWAHWEITVEEETIHPPFKGSIWIDNKTFRVLRLEMQALEIPASFPLDTIETTVEYDYVRIGGGEYLLPVVSENLACWRGTSRCSRNKIEFRNYRRFAAESTIFNTESEVTFGEEAKPEKK